MISKFRTAFSNCAYEIVIRYIMINSEDVHTLSVYRSEEILTAETLIIKKLGRPSFYNSFVENFNLSIQINESFSGRNGKSAHFDRSKFYGATRELFD